MADEVDSLTDSQLRTRLSEFGLPIVPITATTRKLMAKKLKMLIENGNKSAKANRLSLAKYSSGEESDQDDKRKADKARRYTTGGAMLPPSKVPTKTIPRPKTPSEDLPQKSANEVPKESPGKIIQKSITRTTKSITKTIEVKDSSEEEQEPVTTTRRTTRLFTQPTTPPQTRTETIDDSVSDSDEELPEPPKPTLTKSTPSPPFVPKKTTSVFSQPERKSFGRDSNISSRFVSTTTTNTPEPRLEQNYGRLAPSISTSSTTYRGSSTSDNTKTEGYESPFLSEFTRRLEQNKRMSVGVPSSLYENRPSALSSPKPYSELPPRNYDTYTRIAQRSSITPSTPKENLFNNFMKKKNLLQALGVLFLVAFLTFIGLRYYEYTKENVFQIDANHNIPICINGLEGGESYVHAEKQNPGINCVLEENVKPALMLCKYLLPELNRRAVAYQCSDNLVDPFMTGKDVLNFVRTQTPKIKSEQLFADLDNLHLMVLNNQNWGLSIVDKTHNTEITTLGEKSEAYQNLALKVVSPVLPLNCILSNKFYFILSTLAICSVGFAIVYGIQYIIKYLVHKREENERQVYSMVEKIIDILRKEGGENDSQCIAINHIRDRLISPQERQSRNHIWEKAVKFLEENESRARSEVQTVAGEDFRVWRWLASSSHSSNL